MIYIMKYVMNHLNSHFSSELSRKFIKMLTGSSSCESLMLGSIPFETLQEEEHLE